MADLKTLIESEIDRAGEPAFAFEDLDGLRVRRHRTRRVTAAVVGLGIGLVLVLALVNASIDRSAPVPADPPEQSAVDLGIFEPIAGRIVYYGNGKLLGVDPNAPSPGSTLVPLDLEGTPDADGRFESFTMPLGWSSDGTELLFMREDPTDETFPPTRHLFILHADGTETQVTPEPVGGAAISPDGSRVIFAADTGGLYVVDAEGGQPARIADEGGSPTFSPDGTRIAYLSESGQAGLEHVWVANADGTDAQEILKDEALAMGIGKLTWSPAGDRIAMENQQEGRVAIYTFAPDGSDLTKVITGGFNHSWSPDGSQIAYGLPGHDGLSIADADGSNVQTFGVAAPGPWHPGMVEEGAAAPSRSPSASPPPSPVAGSSTFTSTVHGISIDHPVDWHVRPATEPWTDGELNFDSPAADVIYHPALRDRLYFVMASQPFESPSEAEDWDGTAPGDWDGLGHVQLCLPGEGGHGMGGPFPVDGGRAIELQACGSFAVAINWADTRGYVVALIVRDEQGLRETYDHRYFDAALETVDLHPKEAVEAPPEGNG
jgi:hypothetical protein